MPSQSILAQKQQFVADLAEKLKNGGQAAIALSGSLALGLLLLDLADGDSQTLYRRLKHKYQLRKQSLLARQFRVSLNLFLADSLAVNKSKLDRELAVGLFSLFVQQLGGDNDILCGERDGSSTAECAFQTLNARCLAGTLEQCVLDNKIIHAVFTQLLTKLSILFNGDTLVV